MKMYIMRAPSGSGKSTEARKLQAATDATIVSRDIIRQMLGSTEKTALDTAGERRVTKMEHALIREAFNRGESVIIDNMNLDNRRAAAYADLAHLQGVPFEVRNVFNAEAEAIELCVQRSPLPESVVRRQCAKALKMRPLNDYVRVPLMTPVQQDETLQWAYLTDVDGTLADSTGLRRPNDYTKVQGDRRIRAVSELVTSVQQQCISNGWDEWVPSVVFVSGRDEECRPETERWLRDNLGFSPELYMRAHGDKRHDAVVKREILERDLLPRYYILGAIDDRLRVLSMWQASGIFTFNVNQTGADF